MLGWLRRMWSGSKTSDAPDAPASAGSPPPLPDATLAIDALVASSSERAQATDEAAVRRNVLAVIEHVTKKRVDPPVMPAIAPRVLSLVGEEEVDLGALVALIEQDMAISAKLISVANSSFYRRNAEVKTVREAALLLGSETVAQVAIGLACASVFEPDSNTPGTTRWSRLFAHSLVTAQTAATLAAQRGSAAHDVFLAGLFHDVSKAVALRALEVVARDAGLVDSVVDEVIHRVHAYPGDEFTAKWTLPEALTEVCTQHHQLRDVERPDPALLIVALCSSVDAFLSGERTMDLESELRDAARRLHLTSAEFEDVVRRTKSARDRVGPITG
jgi:HD-like signal output (HDOD) protein